MIKKTMHLILSLVLISSLVLAGCTKSNTTPNNTNTPNKTSNNATNNSNTSSNSTNTSNQNTTTEQKVFTIEELKKYDGKNGNPAYVAVNGIVYDVTNARKWHNGEHEGYTAGKDLTDQMGNAPHGNSVLKDCPIVGKLQ